MHPAAGRAHAEIFFQKAGAFAQVDLLDRFAGFFDQHLAELVAAELFQVAVAKVELPAGVGQLGQRLPVPFRSCLLPPGRFSSMASSTCALGHAAGFVLGHPLGVVRSPCRGSPWRRARRANGCRPMRQSVGAVVLGQELIQMCDRPACRSSRGSSRLQLAPSRIRWRKL